MKTPVVDASVVGATFGMNEPAHEFAAAWFRTASQHGLRFVAPVILVPEVASAVARSRGNPRLARNIVTNLMNHSLIEFVPIDSELAIRAAESSIRYRLKGCDAVYVALAQSLGEPLVTLDREQLERARGVVETLTPAEALAQLR